MDEEREESEPVISRFERNEHAKDHYDELMREALSRLQYQMDLAQSLLRALTVGNGGAIIALLTFIGNTDAAVNSEHIWWAFALYGAGLVGVFAAYIAGFFSQQYFYLSTVLEARNTQAASARKPAKYDDLGPYRIGNVALGVAIANVVASLVAFIAASMYALTAIT